MESNYKFYSTGIVVEDKKQGVDYILVSPVETLNNQKAGSIKDFNKESKGDKKSVTGGTFKTEHDSKSYVKARWFSMGNGNRMTAPDVHAGETVMLYKFGDVDDLYWDDMGREPGLRRLEDVTMSFSNKKEKDNKPYDKDSSYWFRVNTKDKFIHFHTSTNDGEAAGYDIKIDTKTGVLSIVDTKGNSVTLDSPAGNLSVKVNTDINLEAGNNINLKAGANITTQAGASISHSAGNSISSSAGSSITDTAGASIGMSAPSVSSEGGGMSIKGNLDVSGGAMTHNGNNVSDTHTHTGVHGETSPPH